MTVRLVPDTLFVTKLTYLSISLSSLLLSLSLPHTHTLARLLSLIYSHIIPIIPSIFFSP